MYQDFYTPIPNIQAYFSRLGIEPSNRLDKEYLDALIYAHQCNILFENLDTYEFHKPISLAIPDLFEKIIVNKRGGYCFELNGLFVQLLKDLGFQAYSCMARIIRGKETGAISAILHRGIIVNLDNRLYYCDVGYGGPIPPGAILIQDAHTMTLHGETFHIHQPDAYWWTLSRTTYAQKQENILQFYTMPQENVDYIALNDYCSKNPASVFTQKYFINLRTKTGSLSILGDIFTITENGQKKIKTIQTKKDLFFILEKYFKIDIKIE